MAKNGDGIPIAVFLWHGRLKARVVSFDDKGALRSAPREIVTVVVCVLFRRREPEPCARRLRRVERLKDAERIFFGNAAPRVRKCYCSAFVGAYRDRRSP